MFKRKKKKLDFLLAAAIGSTQFKSLPKVNWSLDGPRSWAVKSGMPTVWGPPSFCS